MIAPYASSFRPNMLNHFNLSQSLPTLHPTQTGKWQGHQRQPVHPHRNPCVPHRARWSRTKPGQSRRSAAPVPFCVELAIANCLRAIHGFLLTPF